VGLGLGKGQRFVIVAAGPDIQQFQSLEPEGSVSRICDSCLEAAGDEGAEDDIAELVMLELGDDVADHICDATESGGAIKCLCPCRRTGRLD